MNRETLTSSLASKGISNPLVLEAFRKVPREYFVPPSLRKYAYEDTALEIGYGQTISQPFTIASMFEMLRPFRGMKVLEIGTGSGYTAALLYEMAKNKVYSVERISSLAEQAHRNLLRAGYHPSLNSPEGDISIFVRDGSLGLEEFAPFDRVIIHAAVPSPPPPLLEQLNERGILVAPVGSLHSQDLLAFSKDGKVIERREGFIFVPLIGKYGFHETSFDNY